MWCLPLRGFGYRTPTSGRSLGEFRPAADLLPQGHHDQRNDPGRPHVASYLKERQRRKDAVPGGRQRGLSCGHRQLALTLLAPAELAVEVSMKHIKLLSCAISGGRLRPRESSQEVDWKRTTQNWPAHNPTGGSASESMVANLRVGGTLGDFGGRYRPSLPVRGRSRLWPARNHHCGCSARENCFASSDRGRILWWFLARTARTLCVSGAGGGVSPGTLPTGFATVLAGTRPAEKERGIPVSLPDDRRYAANVSPVNEVNLADPAAALVNRCSAHVLCNGD
jgi:hypothetical protein